MKERHARRTRVVTAVALLVLAGGCDRDDNDPTATSKSAVQTEKSGADDPDRSGETPGDNEGAGPPRSLDELPEGVNAVQNEMRKLNTAMQNTLTLIANDQLDAISGQIEKVHPARKLTAKALEKGRYKPPQNPDKLEEFQNLDAQFHEDLKRLLQSAGKDDLRGATRAYSDLVEGCTECHTRFRFE